MSQHLCTVVEVILRLGKTCADRKLRTDQNNYLNREEIQTKPDLANGSDGITRQAPSWLSRQQGSNMCLPRCIPFVDSPLSLTFFSHLHPTFILLLFQRPFSKFPLQLCQLNLHYIYLSVLLSWLMTFAHEKLRALPPSLIETGSFISLFNLLNLILYYPSNVPILNQLNPYS